MSIMMFLVPTVHTEKLQMFMMVHNSQQTWFVKMILVIVLGVQLGLHIHNGGGVGLGEVINGGFGLVLDGSGNSNNLSLIMLREGPK